MAVNATRRREAHVRSVSPSETVVELSPGQYVIANQTERVYEVVAVQPFQCLDMYDAAEHLCWWWLGLQYQTDEMQLVDWNLRAE